MKTTLFKISQFWKRISRGGEWQFTHVTLAMFVAHLMGMQGLYFVLSGQVYWKVIVFQMILLQCGSIGMAAGTHRLWCHRSYKARLPLRLLLMFLHTLAGQHSIRKWSRDHRLHHKFCETDADPYTAHRGIFFAHIGWTLMKEHEEVGRKEKTLDFSDLDSDPVVYYHDKFHLILHTTIHDILPVIATYYMWLPNFHICSSMNFLRWCIGYHLQSMGNSVAHTSVYWKPYDRSMNSADVTWLSPLIGGEGIVRFHHKHNKYGMHNFHHVYPQDYRSTDVGPYLFNIATMFIDLMAKIGQAYDLKTAACHVVEKRSLRTGDGSHPKYGRKG